MANIPNRAEYGNLSCLWGVYKSRYNGNDNTLNIAKLKYSKAFPLNSVDVCPGKVEFPDHIAEIVGRSYYCPFLESRTDARICQWVHSEQHDPQKSKPVGQTAIMMDAMGLADLITSENGIARKIKWTQNAATVSNLLWGSSELDTYFIEMIEGYGPIIALVYYLKALTRDTFLPNEFYNIMQIIPSGELVNALCSKGTRTEVQIWDGNTSNDAVTRSLASLLSLAASAGFVRPDSFPSSSPLTPSTYSKWLNERAKSSNNSFPRNWKVEKLRINQFFSSPMKINKGISYNNFIPKATDRNNGNKCACCDENVLNNARIQYGQKSKNRKLLLIGALAKSFELGKKLDLKKLSELSLSDGDFYISPDSQYETLLNVERHNVALYGCINSEEDGYLTPLINCPISAFGPIPNYVLEKINVILLNPSLYKG